MSSTPPHVIAAADKETHRRRRNNGFLRTCRKTAFWIPGFLVILGVYWLFESQVTDMRSPLVSAGSYAMSCVEILYLLAFAAAMLELLKVSSPGKNDTVHALLMTAVSVVYIVLFTLGAAGIAAFSIYATSEFIVLIFVSVTQSCMAFWINGATLQRTIGHSSDDV